MRRNLYDLLGVRPDDDAETLRKAFLKAAKESHPDHHGDDPDAAARFRQISEAYDILRDAEQRAAYDRLLAAERMPPRSKLKAAFSNVKRHMVTDAVVGVVLVVALTGGYALSVRVRETAVDEGAGMTARDPAIAATRPAESGGTAGRDRPVSAPQMPIVLPIENPVAPADAPSARQTIEVARDGSSSAIPADRAGAKAGRDASAKDRAEEPQDRPDAQSTDVHGVQVPAADTRIVPGPSSSDVASLASNPDRGTPEPAGAGPDRATRPTESAEADVSARIHAVTKRPPASRAPFRHAELAHRYPFARMHAPHCVRRRTSFLREQIPD
jgi:curved DNA-binding protein CbpA